MLHKMKNGWLLAAACVVLAGCAVKDESITSLNGPEVAESPESTAAPITSENTARNVANGGPLATASAFPSSTPPTNRASRTEENYWDDRRVNTRPYEKEEEEHGGGHEAADSHEGGESHEVVKTAGEPAGAVDTKPESHEAPAPHAEEHGGH